MGWVTISEGKAGVTSIGMYFGFSGFHGPVQFAKSSWSNVIVDGLFALTGSCTELPD